ncbi:MAG: ribonuclease HI [SAR324 cluster bacterium]|nr:ribonuclease HI [SAR324 cluster bacterium]
MATPTSTTGLIEIWTDGSCKGNPGPGGWGAIIRSGGDEQELFGADRQTTNNIMEMTGAMKALEATPEGSKIRLTTDSQYVINGITKWINGWKKKGWKKADGNPVLNQEVWKALDQATSKRKVEWVWVKGHAGHEENERVDDLAREAIEKVLGL